uniref:Amine oxidase domain-containing protein n=1 Tax=Ciona savignyi TaxID=51511 RepID=H2ZDW7_CIOSA
MQKNGKVTLSFSKTGYAKSNQIENIDHVIAALPSHALSAILRRSNHVSRSNMEVSDNHELVTSTLGIMLRHIHWVDVAVVNIEYDGRPSEILPHVGFGHLVPSSEASNVLGVVYDSCVFPQHDRLSSPSTRLTCMMGGSWFQDLFGDPDKVTPAELEEAALHSLSEQLGIHKEPSNMHVTVCRKCIPTYRVGHTDLVENAEDFISEHSLPLSLVGSSYWGVSINDCIFNSRIAANNILKKQGFSS